MSRFARTVHIETPVADVWAVMIDVEAWPSWARQFKRLERMDTGPLKLGSRVRVWPKRQPASVWEVTAFGAGRDFTWESDILPGLHMVGGHELAPDGQGTNARFWLEATGVLGTVLSPFLRRTLFSRNTKSATDGLRRHVEGLAG